MIVEGMLLDLGVGRRVSNWLAGQVGCSRKVGPESLPKQTDKRLEMMAAS